MTQPVTAQDPEPGAGEVIWSHDFSNGMPAEFNHNTAYPDSGTWGRAHSISGGGVYEPASISGDQLRMRGPSCSYRGAAYPTHIPVDLQNWELFYRVDARPGSTGHGDRDTGGIWAIGGEPAGNYNDDMSELGTRAAFKDYGSTYRIVGVDQNGDRSSFSQSASANIDSGEWYVRVATSQDEVKTWVKYWQAGNSEPSGWNHEFNAYLNGRPGLGVIGTCKGSSRYNFYNFYELRGVGLDLNSAPNEPSNPSPANLSEKAGLNPDLSVDVSDPDADPVNVTFYDASDNSNLGTVTNISSGSTATLASSNHSFGLETGTSYSWYAKATDGELNTSTNQLNFTTVHKPEILEESATPQGGETVSINPELSVNVSHQDNAKMYVTFFLNGEPVGADQQVNGEGIATLQTEALDANTQNSWYTIVEDEYGNTVNTTAEWIFETNAGEPDATIEYGNNTNFNPDRAVIDVVPEHTDSNYVDYVRLLDENNTVVDQVENAEVGQPVSMIWENLEQDTSYDWSTQIEHGGITYESPPASFTTITLNINLAEEVGNAEAYRIYRRQGLAGENVSFSGGEQDYEFVGSSSSIQLIDASSGLKQTDYCYVATAENIVGESLPSKEACIEGVNVE